MRYSQRKPVQKSFWRRPVGFVIIGVVALLALIVILELTNVTHFFHDSKATSSTIPSTSSNDTTNSSSNGSDQNPSPSPNTTPPPPPPETPKSSGNVGTLLEPSGTFVSNHHPNLDGSPAPSQEQSTCTTTPGATCTITFTQGAVTKTLEAKTADANGTVIWNWDVKTAGFTPGSWKITATASANGQSKSAADAQDLVVQP